MPEELPGPAKPTDDSERLVGLDVLRGFALFGVLLTNASVLARPLSDALQPPAHLADEGVGSTSELLEFVAWGIFDGLLVTKFVALFSMLFGMGLVLQTQRAEAKGLPFPKLFRRRLGILAALGFVHGCLLFEGDILLVYAVVGAVLFLFRNQSPRALLWLSTIPFAMGVLLSLLWAGLDLESLESPSKLNEVFAESPRPTSPLDVLTTRPLDFLGWLIISSLISFNLRVVALFFLGAAIMKSGWTLPSHLGTQRKVALFGLGAGLSIELLSVYLATFEQPAAGMRMGTAICDEFGSVILSLGYAGSVFWLVHAGHLQWLGHGLAAVGRTALTNYLLQSVIMNVVFMDFLLGYYKLLSRAEVLCWFSAIFLCQIFASMLWLSRFKMGPFEWVWRSLTYRGIRGDKMNCEKVT